MLSGQDSRRRGRGRRGDLHRLHHLYATIDDLDLRKNRATEEHADDQSAREPENPEDRMRLLAHLLDFRSGVGPALDKSLEAWMARLSTMAGILKKLLEP